MGAGWNRLKERIGLQRTRDLWVVSFGTRMAMGGEVRLVFGMSLITTTIQLTCLTTACRLHGFSFQHQSPVSALQGHFGTISPGWFGRKVEISPSWQHLMSIFSQSRRRMFRNGHELVGSCGYERGERGGDVGVVAILRLVFDMSLLLKAFAGR